jgi:hypothetical protein
MHPNPQEHRKGETSMKPTSQRPVGDEENVAPVTILDGQGRVIRIVPVEEFRRIHGVPEQPGADKWRRRRERARPSEIEERVTEHPVPR